MPRVLQTYKFQKCTDIDREYPLFEVVADGEITIMDMSSNDVTRELEVFFHDHIARVAIPLTLLIAILEEGRGLLESEMS